MEWIFQDDVIRKLRRIQTFPWSLFSLLFLPLLSFGGHNILVKLVKGSSTSAYCARPRFVSTVKISPGRGIPIIGGISQNLYS